MSLHGRLPFNLGPRFWLGLSILGLIGALIGLVAVIVT